jgi:two-component system, NarL family, invasion response regulator UvrY
MTAAIRVVVADDHPIIVDGVQNVLAQHPAISLVGVARSFARVSEVLNQTAPDVLILDVSGMGGSVLGLMSRLQREHAQIAVVIFSSMVDLAPELLDLGARGYVTKDELSRELVRAIKVVATGDRFVSPVVAEFIEQTSQLNALSQKELVALKLMVQGMGTVQIAEQMGVNPHTAQNYFTSMRRKTGCMSRTQLMEWYRRVYGSAS